MIQLNKRMNIRAFSMVCLGNLVVWSLLAIAQMIWKGGLATPVIYAIALGFCTFGTALGAFTDKDNQLPKHGLALSLLLPLPIIAGVLIM
ncbi:hypothetical protein BAAM0499_03150 [Bifidobacterium animalis subsp. animalis MCC 0499]|uniref:hypothetical protein n=1 Tax=Bifidobacterium animalis TaxID=28025 RepID=UPI00069BEC21|nr:hypothetical protein [Bifidobacterium animalis]KOA60889.1 hypothetical protein BAAM0499_03150 [Bifidobacterium animalis subsp. animalis MCC 0499]